MTAGDARETRRIALIDSGVNAAHSHVREELDLELGPKLSPTGELLSPSEQRDVLGHGTAAAAAIGDLAPGATLYSVQVFDDRPTCPFEHLIAALEHVLEWEPELINLSLGTTRREWSESLTAFLAVAAERGVQVISPAAWEGLPSFPGSLPNATGVLMDARLDRAKPELRETTGHRFWYASPYPRELPGLPRDANLVGVSMASANLTGYLASQ